MARRRPLIGITSDYNDKLTQYALPYPYCEAVEAAGGLPVMLPYRVPEATIPAYVDALDGIVFSGGNDLDPAAWGEPRHDKAVAIDPLRERFERALIAEVERRRLPALGICLGSQLMNVHRGGTLHQFIGDFSTDIEHRRLGTEWDARHDVTLAPESIVATTIGGTTLRANTSHKQSIRQPGQGLRVIATAPDGVVEGVEDPTFPLFVGVQWHPERQHAEPAQRAIFRLLIDRAGEFADARAADVSESDRA